MHASAKWMCSVVDVLVEHVCYPQPEGLRGACSAIAHVQSPSSFRRITSPCAFGLQVLTRWPSTLCCWNFDTKDNAPPSPIVQPCMQCWIVSRYRRAPRNKLHAAGQAMQCKRLSELSSAEFYLLECTKLPSASGMGTKKSKHSTLPSKLVAHTQKQANPRDDIDRAALHQREQDRRRSLPCEACIIPRSRGFPLNPCSALPWLVSFRLFDCTSARSYICHTRSSNAGRQDMQILAWMVASAPSSGVA